MSSIPKGYHSKLDLVQTQLAIKLTKDTFEKELSKELKLIRVSAPLFVKPQTGLNDYLSGKEQPVSFFVKNLDEHVEVVQSLAKWKRYALDKYRILNGRGIYTDMNAIRPDEELDNIHSIYVDQWDWEKTIHQEDRTIDFLKQIVQKIYAVFLRTQKIVKAHFPILTQDFAEEITFITSEELLQMYPHLSSKERENAICKDKQSVFVLQIGKTLSDGTIHDDRAPDYDDWELNGDILVYYPVLDIALELSSMGIRVNAYSLQKQLTLKNQQEKQTLPYHKRVLDGSLPLSIGGGIGQSRLCMLVLEKAHIGEVQSSVWNEEELAELKESGLDIL